MVRLDVVQVTMVIDSDMDTLISVLYHGANSIDRFEAGLASNFRWLHFKLSSILSPEAAKKWNYVIIFTLQLINASDGLDVLLHLNDNLQYIFQLKSPG